MIEEWRDIPGYEGRYMVSNHGAVLSLPKAVISPHGRIGYTKPRILKQQTYDGYYYVPLSDENHKSKMCRVHRLVAAAFIPNPDNLPMINHKDENRKNNRVDNLEWCTNAYNQSYGSCKKKQREKAINNPKTSKAVVCVESGVIYPSTREASRSTGIDQSQIWHCIKDGWRVAKGFHWAYVGGD